MNPFFKNTSLVKNNPIYLKNIKFGKPRPGHPEGTIEAHIQDLQKNLTLIQRHITNDEFWKLLFMIHVHDTFKVDADREVHIEHPKNHATLAREFASNYTNNSDVLNIIQYHDVNYFLWKQLIADDMFDVDYLRDVLEKIENHSMYLIFTFIDGYTPGKDLEKLMWFYSECRKLNHELVIDEEILRVFGG